MTDWTPELEQTSKELDASATPGPWDNTTTNYQPYGYPRAIIRYDSRPSGNQVITPSVDSSANADWIAHARTALPAAVREIERLRAENDTWTCFHCGFKASDRAEAAAHFGDMDDEYPLCIIWKDLDADGRASEYQSQSRELDAEREENSALRTTNEGLEYRLLEYEDLAGSRFKGCKSLNDAFNLFDTMEGRALAAEEKIKILQAQCDELRKALKDVHGFLSPFHDGQLFMAAKIKALLDKEPAK